jgi:hypothetical protein
MTAFAVPRHLDHDPIVVKTETAVPLAKRNR